MSSSRSKRTHDAGLVEELLGALAGGPRLKRYVVAYSGGVDSAALLHALASAVAERKAGFAVSAVHVDHGLHADAAAWAEHCRRTCRRLGVELEVVAVDARARPGESPEAAARAARYAALAERLDADSAVCTAHHQRDQAETVLLQLLRGAGPRGLAAMPRVARLGAGWLLRPCLALPPARLAAHARAHDLDWIEDPANADPRFDRSHLRHVVLPALEARWPAAVATLAGVATLQAEAAELIAEEISRDLARARGTAPGTLAVDALRALRPARARALLRAWIEQRALPLPGRARLESALDTLLGARDDASPLIEWPGAELRRYRGDVYLRRPPPAADPALILSWCPPRELALPYGRLRAVPVRGHGLAAARCADARLEVRFRRGGERCRPAGRAHGQRLKKLLQARRVPPWLRGRVPLVYADGMLAAVAGLWVCEGFQAAAGAPGWELVWELPETPPAGRADDEA